MKPLSFCSNLVFVFWTKLSHRKSISTIGINCDFTDTFAVLTETADFAEFTYLCSQRTLGNQVNIDKYNT